MKKTNIIVAAIALLAVALPVGAQNKPASTWQTYYPETKQLVVHESEDPNSPVYFVGDVADYNGSATFPPAAPSEYSMKLRMGAEAFNAQYR